MKIAICENNRQMLKDMYETILQYDEFKEEVKLDKYSDGETLLQYTKKHTEDPYDIILMDICLTDTNSCHDTADGIETAKKIKNITPISLVVYMSSYSFLNDLSL